MAFDPDVSDEKIDYAATLKFPNTETTQTKYFTAYSYAIAYRTALDYCKRNGLELVELKK